MTKTKSKTGHIDYRCSIVLTIDFCCSIVLTILPRRPGGEGLNRTSMEPAKEKIEGVGGIQRVL